MKKITTYYDWANVLQKYADGDDSTLELLEKATIKLDSGTADKFYLLLEKTYKKRKQKWLDNLQTKQKDYQLKTIDEFDIWIRNWKNNLMPLLKLASLPGLPNDIKDTFKDDLKALVDDIKSQLIKNLSGKYSDNNEKLLFYLKNFDIYEYKNDLINAVAPNKKNTGRKIIF